MNDYAASIDWWRPARAAAGAGTGSRLAFHALLAFLFVLFLSPQSFLPALAPLRIAFLAASLGILAHATDRLSRGRSLSVQSREIWLTAGLVAWSILTLPLSYWPGGSLALLADMFLKTVAVFWLLANVVSTRARIKRVVWALSLMGIPLAATAVANFSSGAFLTEPGFAVQRIMGYDSGLASNPNDLALVLNLIVPMSVALLLLSRNLVVRAALLATLTLLVLGVVATFSRAGFLTLAVMLVAYCVRLARQGRPGFVLAALLAATSGLMVLPADYKARLATIVALDEDPTGSAQARRDDTLTAVRFVLSNPVIGAGVGMNILALNEERGEAWKAVHNVYLEYGVDLGLPGLVLFLLLVGACFGSVRSVQRECAPDPARLDLFHLAGGIEVALLAFCVEAFFHPVAYQFYFYLFAGLAVAVRKTCDAEAAAAGHPEARDARWAGAAATQSATFDAVHTW